MPAPWENDAIVGQLPAQQAAPQFPGVVQGRPKPPPAPDPVQDRRDEIGLNRDEIGLQKDRIALEKLQAETAAGELSSKLGKEAGFYLRARSAGEAFNTLNVGPESQRRAAAGSVLPENWINQFTPEERQKAETFMEDFIAASLRYESGAAIGQDEFDRQARIYFPQPGDSQGTLEAKRKLRENMIESLGMGAGPEAVTEVDKYLQSLGGQERTTEATFEAGFFDAQGNPYPMTSKARYLTRTAIHRALRSVFPTKAKPKNNVPLASSQKPTGCRLNSLSVKWAAQSTTRPRWASRDQPWPFR